MTERSMFWNGASIGDADALTVNAADGIGYRMANINYVSPYVDILSRALWNGTGNRGVLNNWLNELAVTGAVSPVSVDTGAAIIYGLYYENDAALNVAVTSPTYYTRIDRLVVRRNWTTQTARITLIPGIEGSGSPPELTQSPAPNGTGLYDIPLAQISITTGGAITLTDEREFVTFTTIAADGSIDTTQIVNEAVDFVAREQVTKRLVIGGSDLEPLTSNFSYTELNDALHSFQTATWGAAAASMEGWQVTGADAFGFSATFKIPADWVPGTNIAIMIRWIDDFAGTSEFSWFSAWQAYLPGDYTTDTIAQYSGGYSGLYTYTPVSTTSVLDTAHISVGAPITGLTGEEMIAYYVQWENDAGAEEILVVGIDVIYTGYA